MYHCHMCMTAHAAWRDLEDIEGYYREAGCRPSGAIVQCPYCLFRTPRAHLWEGPKPEETSINVQEYAQTEMF